jgi:hypothetical protein
MRLLPSLLIASALLAGQPQTPFPLPPAEPQQPPVDFVCPMDPDVHSPQPGKCPRCGMTLIAGIPDETEYPVILKPAPARLNPGKPVQLAFEVLNPKTAQRVTDFEIVHDKLFHMFIVSQDLEFFVHDHPVRGEDSVFRYTTVLPKSGMYRVLSDFYPKGGVPQLVAKTLIVPGGPITAGAQLKPDLSPKKTENMVVSLATDPPQPIAGLKTLLFFHLNPADGLEQYLSAWGHMLAASQDLIDLIHTHPFLANGGPQVQFNLIFPRPGVYRIWVQFQRKGVVNTARFDVPVTELK